MTEADKLAMAAHKFCHKCGKQMQIRKILAEYHRKTGDPVHRVYWACPEWTEVTPIAARAAGSGNPWAHLVSNHNCPHDCVSITPEPEESAK